MSVNAQMEVKKVSMEGKVLRCTCSKEMRAAAGWHGLNNLPCPKPRLEDLGVIVDQEYGDYAARVVKQLKRAFGVAKSALNK